MARFRGAIFDLDGTLLDSMWVWQKVDRDFLGVRNIPVPEDYLRTVGAMSFDTAAKYTVRRFDLKERPEDLMSEWHARAVEAYRKEVRLKPGAKAFLRRLMDGGISCAVATAADPRLYRPVLEREGILSWFHSVTSLAEVGGNKGEPSIYLRAAEKMGLKPCDCAVFEDLYAGLRAAEREGFFTVGLAEPCAPEEQEAMRRTARVYLHDFAEPAALALLEETV